MLPLAGLTLARWSDRTATLLGALALFFPATIALSAMLGGLARHDTSKVEAVWELPAHSVTGTFFALGIVIAVVAARRARERRQALIGAMFGLPAGSLLCWALGFLVQGLVLH